MQKKLPKSRMKSNINRGDKFNYIIPGGGSMFDIFVHDQTIKDEERIDFRLIVEKKRVTKSGFFITEKQWPAFFDVCERINKSKNNKGRKKK